MRKILLVLLLFWNVQVFSEGFDGNYQVKVGDYNGDGREDLYVVQNPQIIILHGDIATPIVLPPPVKPLLLEQQTDTSFQVVQQLTTNQISSANQWPSTSIKVTTSDLNIDGYFDLILEGVSDLIIGAIDQIGNAFQN